jgi:hypothetical protein
MRECLVVNWPEPQHIAWLAREQFKRTYSVRREHLAGLGMDVTGLDAALADTGGTEVGVFTTNLRGQDFAFFITRAEVEQPAGFGGRQQSATRQSPKSASTRSPSRLPSASGLRCGPPPGAAHGVAMPRSISSLLWKNLASSLTSYRMS